MDQKLTVKKPSIPLRFWNFANSGKGLLTFYGFSFAGAVSSVVYMKIHYNHKRKQVVRQKIIARHLASPQYNQVNRV